jgi:hypothetical protein
MGKLEQDGVKASPACWQKPIASGRQAESVAASASSELQLASAMPTVPAPLPDRDRMSGSPNPPGRAPIGTIGLLALAYLLYAGAVADIAGFGQSDLAGNGMALAFATMLEIALWAVLGLLLLVAGLKRRMAAGAAGLAFVLLPLSGVASVLATEEYNSEGGLPILVPLLLPPVIAFYAI